MTRLIKLITIPLLAAILVLCFSYYLSEEETLHISIYETKSGPNISGRLFSEQSENTINAFSTDSNHYFLFLPPYAKDKKINIESSLTVEEILPGTAYAQNAAVKASYLIDSKYQFTLLTGSNIPTAYINLQHDLSYIESDKELKDSGQIAILNPDGGTAYIGKLKEIGGRGNTSWEQDKKPYNITLGNDISLFDMSPSKDYSLVSSSDLSFLKNYISNEMASSMNSLTLERSFINLYINDNFQGIYELCEKVSTQSIGISNLEQETARLNLAHGTLQQLTTNETLDDWNQTITGKWWDYSNNPENITGGYLLEADQALRYENEPSGFTLNSGSYIVSKSPAYLSEAQYQYISSYIQDCETAMQESVGLDNYDLLSNYIDIPSFVSKYLIEEVSKNIDCSSTSQFFYKDIDGFLYAGPPWDFDWAYGVPRTHDDINFDSAEGFSARDIPGTLTWWQLLYYNNAFHQDIVNMYQNTLYPWLNQLIGEYIPEWEKQLTDSAVMDYIRWKRVDPVDWATVSKAYHNEVTSITDFLNIRKEFLYSEWIQS